MLVHLKTYFRNCWNGVCRRREIINANVSSLINYTQMVHRCVRIRKHVNRTAGLWEYYSELQRYGAPAGLVVKKDASQLKTLRWSVLQVLFQSYLIRSFVPNCRLWSWMNPTKRLYSEGESHGLAWKSLNEQEVTSSESFSCIRPTKQPRVRWNTL